MQPFEHIIAEEEDRRNQKPRLAVEYSFNQVVSKFTHVDFFHYHRFLQQGKLNWKNMHILWDMHVFF
jgi:hypothetical protein